jgi:hypothetical protein
MKYSETVRHQVKTNQAISWNQVRQVVSQVREVRLRFPTPSQTSYAALAGFMDTCTCVLHNGVQA